MDKKIKEELIYDILTCSSIIAAPLKDGDYMFLFRLFPGQCHRVTDLSKWKKCFFKKTGTVIVFYRGKIIYDEKKTEVIKDVNGKNSHTLSLDHKVKKICSKHFREIMKSPEFLTSNLFDDRIKISNPKYVTPIKNLLREVGLINKKGPRPKYSKGKLNRAEKTYRRFLDVGKRIIRKQREIERENRATIDNTGISEIDKKLKLGDFRLVKEVVLYSGSTNMALRETSKVENIPFYQLKKMLHDKKYREKIVKRY